jgi:YndJ-like protein
MVSTVAGRAAPALSVHTVAQWWALRFETYFPHDRLRLQSASAFGSSPLPFRDPRLASLVRYWHFLVPLGLSVTRPSDMWVCYGAPAALIAVVLRARTDDRNWVAVGCAVVWMLLTSAAAVRASNQWIFGPQLARLSLQSLLPLAAMIELAVAATWLVAACMQVELLGFSATIVLLTAVHFHFAGFGACMVVVLRLRGAKSSAERRYAGWAGVLVLGASPVVAVGHLTVGALELLGGLLLTAGVWLAAYLSWRESRRTVGIVRVLLIVGALAPVVPMLFALHYGLTRVSDIQQIRFSTIALIHGGLNAFGFLLANLVAASVTQHETRAHETRAHETAEREAGCADALRPQDPVPLI